MSYFSIRCCSPDIRKIVLLVVNILIGCWGAVHLGYAGSFSVVKQKSLEYLGVSTLTASIITQMKLIPTLTDGPLAYYVVTGVVALVISLFLVLVVLEVIGKENRIFYFKLIAALLLVNLLLEFGAAIYSTIMLSYYGLKFEAELNLTQDFIDALPFQYLKDYYNGVRNFYRLTQAEVIVLWILVLPATAMMIFALFEEFFKNQEPDEPTKIAPQRLNTEQKSKVYEKTQVQSFGVESFGAPNKSQESINLKR